MIFDDVKVIILYSIREESVNLTFNNFDDYLRPQ